MGEAAIYLLASAIALLAVALMIMRPMRLELEFDFKPKKPTNTTDCQPDSTPADTETN